MPRIFRDWWKVFILHALMYASIKIIIYKFRIKIPGVRLWFLILEETPVLRTRVTTDVILEINASIQENGRISCEIIELLNI